MATLYFNSRCTSLAQCPSGSLRKAVPEHLVGDNQLSRQEPIMSIFHFIAFVVFRGGVP